MQPFIYTTVICLNSYWLLFHMKGIKICSACCYELLSLGGTLPSYLKSKFIGHYFTEQQTTVNVFNSADGKNLCFSFALLFC